MILKALVAAALSFSVQAFAQDAEVPELAKAMKKHCSLSSRWFGKSPRVREAVASFRGAVPDAKTELLLEKDKQAFLKYGESATMLFIEKLNCMKELALKERAKDSLRKINNAVEEWDLESDLPPGIGQEAYDTYEEFLVEVEPYYYDRFTALREKLGERCQKATNAECLELLDADFDLGLFANLKQSANDAVDASSADFTYASLIEGLKKEYHDAHRNFRASRKEAEKADGRFTPKKSGTGQ